MLGFSNIKLWCHGYKFCLFKTLEVFSHVGDDVFFDSLGGFFFYLGLIGLVVGFKVKYLKGVDYHGPVLLTAKV